MANLDGCNIYKNNAVEVCFLAFLEHLESSAPLELMFAHGSQFGRLSISGTATRIGVDFTGEWGNGGGLCISGTATLANTNVYANQASRARLPSELYLDFHPAPQWRLTAVLLRPAG